MHRVVGVGTSSFGGTLTASGTIGAGTGSVVSSFGGTIAVKGRPRLSAGVRASAGRVGYRGDPADLTVLQYGDSLIGTVFEGTGTGWADGVALEVRGSDLVVDGYHFPDALVIHVSGTNLTIKNSIIQSPPGSTVIMTVGQASYTLGQLTIEDTTIIGTPGPGIVTTQSAVAGDGRLVIKRCDISGSADGIHANGYEGTDFASGTIISQIYLHDLQFLDVEQHLDYIQFFNNNGGYTSDTGQTYGTIEHCSHDFSLGPGNIASNAFITAGWGGTTGPWIALKIDNNLIGTGAYHLRISNRTVGNVVTNNDFGFRWVQYDEFGLSDLNPQFTIDNTTWTNNVDGYGNPYNINEVGPNAPGAFVETSFGGTFNAQGVSRKLGQVVTTFGGTLSAAGIPVNVTTGVVSSLFGGTFTSIGTTRRLGIVSSNFGGAFLGAGNDRQLGQVVTSFGFTSTVAGVDRILGVVSSNFGGAFIGAGNDRQLGQIVSLFGGQLNAAGRTGGLSALGIASSGVFVPLGTKTAAGGIWVPSSQKVAIGGNWSP